MIFNSTLIQGVQQRHHRALALYLFLYLGFCSALILPSNFAFAQNNSTTFDFRSYEPFKQQQGGPHGGRCPKCPRYDKKAGAVYNGKTCMQIPANKFYLKSLPFSLTATIASVSKPKAGQMGTIAAVYSSAQNQRSFIFGIDDHGRLKFIMSGDGTGPTSLGVISGPLSTNNLKGPTVVNVQIDTDGTVSFYVNGTLISSSMLPTQALGKVLNRDLYVGCSEKVTYSPDFLLKGSIQSLRIDDHVLTPSLVNNLVPNRQLTFMRVTPQTADEAVKVGKRLKALNATGVTLLLNKSEGLLYDYLNKAATFTPSIAHYVKDIKIATPGYGIFAPSASDHALSIIQDVVKKVADLKKRLPVISEVVLDDYFSSPASSPFSNYTQETALSTCNVANQANITISPVIYCGSALNGRQKDLSSRYSKNSTQEKVFADLFESKVEFSRCIKSVQLFMGANQYRSGGKSLLNDCINSLAPTGLDIRLGGYTTDLSSMVNQVKNPDDTLQFTAAEKIQFFNDIYSYKNSHSVTFFALPDGEYPRVGFEQQEKNEDVAVYNAIAKATAK